MCVYVCVGPPAGCKRNRFISIQLTLSLIVIVIQHRGYGHLELFLSATVWIELHVSLITLLPVKHSVSTQSPLRLSAYYLIPSHFYLHSAFKRAQ